MANQHNNDRPAIPLALVLGNQHPFKESDSYRDSLYIAALDRHLGMSGFISHVSDHGEGVDYSFDFYHPRTKRLVKIFRTIETAEINQYAAHPYKDRTVFVIDINNQKGPHIPRRRELLHSVPENVIDAASVVHAYIFCQGKLWSVFDEARRVCRQLSPIEFEKGVTEGYEKGFHDGVATGRREERENLGLERPIWEIMEGDKDI